MALPQPVLPARSGVVLRPDLADNPDVFPLLRGASFPSKAEEWSTTTLTSKSGRRFKKQNYTYPIWKFSIDYSGDHGLSQKTSRLDLDRLIAFFGARAGQFGDFYYYDPTDNLVEGQTLGIGDGTKTRFQLVRSIRNWTEPVFALNGPPAVTVAGQPAGDYSIEPRGVLVFEDPPPDLAVVAWSGSFLFWCEFTQDEFSAQQLGAKLWNSEGLEFQTIRP